MSLCYRVKDVLKQLVYGTQRHKSLKVRTLIQNGIKSYKFLVLNTPWKDTEWNWSVDWESIQPENCYVFISKRSSNERAKSIAKRASLKFEKKAFEIKSNVLQWGATGTGKRDKSHFIKFPLSTSQSKFHSITWKLLLSSKAGRLEWKIE